MRITAVPELATWVLSSDVFGTVTLISIDLKLMDCSVYQTFRISLTTPDEFHRLARKRNHDIPYFVSSLVHFICKSFSDGVKYMDGVLPDN